MHALFPQDPTQSRTVEIDRERQRPLWTTVGQRSTRITERKRSTGGGGEGGRGRREGNHLRKVNGKNVRDKQKAGWLIKACICTQNWIICF